MGAGPNVEFENGTNRQLQNRNNRKWIQLEYIIKGAAVARKYAQSKTSVPTK